MSPESASPAADAAIPVPAAPPARILLVDDDPVNQMVALNLIRRRGWQADAAVNGRVALEKLAGQTFSLVLMDLQMPEMDGYEATTAIRQNEAQPGGTPGRPRIPIIALTTASQPGTRERCLAAGMDDYLTKPIVPKELYAAIERFVGGPGSQSATA